MSQRTIPIISLWQPWASLVAHGEKRIETRSWKWPKDMPCFLAIHAAQKWNGELLSLSSQGKFSAALALHGREAGKRGGNLPLGAVVGVVRLVECVATTLLTPMCLRTLASQYLRESPNEREFGDYSFGRYAWVFDRHLAVEPIPMRGHQSLWTWEPTEEVRQWCEDHEIAMPS